MNVHAPMSGIDRRTFLKWTAGGLAALAAVRWQDASADEGRRDLIAVSSAGDKQAGVAPSISLIDPDSYDVLATLPLAGHFSFPATRWDPARDLIWSGVPGGDHQAVMAFRLSTGEHALDIPTGSSQNYTELTPDGSEVIAAARFQDRYLRIGADPAADSFGKVLATLDTYKGANPCDITVSADGRYAYAPDRGGDTVTTIDLEDFSIASTVPLEQLTPGPLQPYMCTVSPTGRVLLVENAIVKDASQTGSESILDLSAPDKPVEVARLSVDDGLGRGPMTSEFTADGRYGIVICRDSSELSIINTGSHKVVGNVSFPDGSNPLTGTFAYADHGDTFFVPLPGRDAVAAVKTPAFEVDRLIPVGPRPMGVVFLEAAVPDRSVSEVPMGAALASGRTFPAGCPDRCCGPV